MSPHSEKPTTVRVLIVEDDSAVRDTLSAILTLEGLNVAACASAREALQHLSEREFDLVITDMRMETPTAGLDVVQAAAQRPARPFIVVLTAFPLPPRDARASGADKVLLKATDPFKLITELRGMISVLAKKKGGGEVDQRQAS